MPILPEVAARLHLGPMVERNTAPHQTPYTVPVDHISCRTGISAQERARTVRAIIDPATQPDDLVRPGHLFPLVAKEGGVLRRAGHTEATVDLARLAGLTPAGVLCEVLDGTGVASRERLHEIAREHGLPIVSIEGLIRYRRMREKLVHRVAEAELPTRYGRGRIIGYRVQHEPGNEPVAIVMGDLRSVDAPLVRLHSSCFTGDLLDSLRCDCGDQLHMALAMIGDEGAGALIYLPQEGQGHRPDRENPSLQPSGQRARYRAGQHGTGLPRRHARLRHRLADPQGPWALPGPSLDQQPQEDRRFRLLRLRPEGRRPGSDRRPGSGRDGGGTWTPSATRWATCCRLSCRWQRNDHCD